VLTKHCKALVIFNQMFCVSSIGRRCYGVCAVAETENGDCSDNMYVETNCLRPVILARFRAVTNHFVSRVTDVM